MSTPTENFEMNTEATFAKNTFVKDLIQQIKKTYKTEIVISTKIIDEIDLMYPVSSGCWFADWLNHRLYAEIMAIKIMEGKEVPAYVDWEDLEEHVECDDDDDDDDNDGSLLDSYDKNIQNESESEEEKEIHSILNKRKEKIEKIFCPQTERERKCLYSIAQEVDFIDIKPYSHNIIGLNLNILKDNEGYYDSKIKEVVKMFKLDKKGWGNLLKKY